MESKRRVGVLVATALIVAALVVGICLTGGSGGEEESIQEMCIRDRRGYCTAGLFGFILRIVSAT